MLVTGRADVASRPKLDETHFVQCTFVFHLIYIVDTSDGNLLKNRPRASTSEYKKPPINLRLFQNTVKFLDNFFLSPKKQKSENETNFTQLPDSPVLNTINSYLYFNILITAPGYPSKTSA